MTAMEQETAAYYTAEVAHEKQGPWTYAQMVSMVREGRCTPATLWWSTGMARWQRICTFPLPARKYNLVSATAAGMRRAVRFTGRSGRAEFWFFALGVFLFFIAIIIIHDILVSTYYTVQENATWVTFAFMVYCGVALLAAAARRLHDAGLPTLLLLFLLVPLFGPLGLAPFLAFPPEDTNNPHGSHPLAPEE